MVDLVDYNPDTSEEQVWVYDGRASSINDYTKKWVVDDDIIDFPVVSQMFFMTVRWSLTGVASGRLAFVVRSKQGNWNYPLGSISLFNNILDGNRYGMVSNVFNQPSDEYLSIFHRYNWEKVDVRNCTFSNNKFGSIAVYSMTKYNSLYFPASSVLETSLKIAEVSYRIHSCIFTNNGGGIVASHVGLGFSNNVWIWEVSDLTFTKNQAGGLFIEFPRVNLMFTDLFNHSININGSLFSHNDDFEFVIGGFYCNASISSNKFHHNKCKRGCIEFSGTEKDFEFRDNQVSDNMGRYMLEVNMNSHTPYTQWVEATVVYNSFENNEGPRMLFDRNLVSEISYAVGVRGLQNITINRNLVNNPYMSYELLGGQAASKFENYLDVTENWWGSIDQVVIQKRLFDFDDWNNFAVAEYIPFLMNPTFEAKPSTENKLRNVIDLSKPLGGRISESIKIPFRSQPYVVERDLTVMEGYSMVIDEGVTMQFYPGVGILVLGSLFAYGSSNNKITFQPVDKSKIKKTPSKRSLEDGKPRLYIHPDLHPYVGYEMRLRGGESENGGFLEIYNNTEQRWTIVCDDAFNEKTAEVACKTMKKEHSNVVVQRSRFYDIFVLGYQLMAEQVIEWFWRETMICDGSESNLNDCKHRLNYDLQRCMLQGNYVYMRCGDRNLAENFDYWGNIRFSSTSFESDYSNGIDSKFYHANIYGAGVLHEEKVAAVQSIYKAPDSKHVSIQNSAWNGYDFIAPDDQFSILDGAITNNNGYAVGTIILNGQSSEDDSQFVTLQNSEMPQNLHGIVRMCTVEKFILIQKRTLVYYRYSFDNVDCIKIFRSKEPHKQIGFRFLQFNLFNDSIYTNAVELYDGEFFAPDHMISKLTYNSTIQQQKKFFTTSARFDTLGVRITASTAYGGYGFVAEVVTLPISSRFKPDFGLNQQQTISRNNMADNLRGGILYRNVGENNPRIVIEKNHVVNCGLKVLNNTFPGVIDIFLQNTRLLTVSNNFISNCAGGITINTTTKSSESSIYANVTNNLIMRSTHGEPMHLEGHHFQKFQVTHNYVSNNDVQFRNIISAFGLQLNFTSNVLVKNVAQCILNASLQEKIDISQRYSYNSIYNNHAFAYNRSTICLKSAKFQFTHNFLLNPYNVFEMVTFNRTK
ncbi:hypothetical protein HELRODRAFT_193396, partial [Helobdella robusta]|uniref:SRCR domain-containing protein n=1 Tax=Helobdella robusta TaxID=6412 RepID=T1FUY2_HELRO